jgi:hypothetical protein
VLLDRLAEARRQGLAFEDVWPDALAAALAPIPPGVERRAWLAALTETQPAWRAGWERGQPPRREQAVLALAGLETAA